MSNVLKNTNLVAHAKALEAAGDDVAAPQSETLIQCHPAGSFRGCR